MKTVRISPEQIVTADIEVELNDDATELLDSLGPALVQAYLHNKQLEIGQEIVKKIVNYQRGNRPKNFSIANEPDKVTLEDIQELIADFEALRRTILALNDNKSLGSFVPLETIVESVGPNRSQPEDLYDYI